VTALVEFSVRNPHRVVAALNELEYKVRKKVLRKAVRAGGAVFVKSAKRNAPIRTGRLKRSITQKVKTYRPSGTIVSVIGQLRGKQLKDTKRIKHKRGGISGQGKVVPIHLVDQPTKRHEIFATNYEYLRLGAHWYAFSVWHPGTRGRNFMTRSYSQDKERAVNAFDRKAEFEVDREAARIAAEFNRFTRFG